MLLATTLVRVVRLHADTVAQDATAVEMARAIAPTVTTADQADAAVHALLAARGLGGRSFSGPVAQLVSAMQNVPDVTMTTLSRTGDGTLATTLTAASVDRKSTRLNPSPSCANRMPPSARTKNT